MFDPLITDPVDVALKADNKQPSRCSEFIINLDGDVIPKSHPVTREFQCTSGTRVKLFLSQQGASRTLTASN